MSRRGICVRIAFQLIRSSILLASLKYVLSKRPTARVLDLGGILDPGIRGGHGPAALIGLDATFRTDRLPPYSICGIGQASRFPACRSIWTKGLWGWPPLLSAIGLNRERVSRRYCDRFIWLARSQLLLTHEVESLSMFSPRSPPCHCAQSAPCAFC